ncbi:DnaJ domain family protein [Leishmania donovani]|uniref:DnaJ domain family protein n=1 Tax=Leishmania donovani TaxID=5661 RepID=A0A504X7I0_LEIDO|nr:DnaJ domain family protein [Leishmania donovani]
MPLSIHARTFVPSSTTYSPSGANEQTVHAADSKDCVCIAFYENGKCPYGSHCEHAHRFSELNTETQMKLLRSVPVESIPAHFFGASHSRDEMLAALNAVLPRTLTAEYGCFSPIHRGEAERTVSTRRRPPGKDRQLVVPHIGPQSPTLNAASLSSRTSSSAESTYYDVLALPRDASQDDIIAKYRSWQKDGFKRMRQVDPVGAEAVDRMIVEARNVLGNPILRSDYDQQLPSAPMKQQPWSAASCGAGLTSTSTTPSKHHTQGQSSTTSSTSEVHHRLGESHKLLGHSRSNSSVYYADYAAPVVTISSLHNGESIW